MILCLASPELDYYWSAIGIRGRWMLTGIIKISRLLYHSERRAPRARAARSDGILATQNVDARRVAVRSIAWSGAFMVLCAIKDKGMAA